MSKTIEKLNKILTKEIEKIRNEDEISPKNERICSQNIKQEILQKNERTSMTPINKKNFARLCEELEENKITPNQIVIQIGLGIQETYRFAIRILALLIPGLDILQKFYDKKKGMIPIMSIYLAGNFIAKTNNYDIKKTLETSSKIYKFVNKYVDMYYPKIKNFVIYNFDIPYDSKLQEELVTYIPTISNDLKLSKYFEKLKQFEQHHSCHPNTFVTTYKLYAIANAYYSAAYCDPFNILRDKKYLILIGGISEKPFFSITNEIYEKTRMPWKIIPLILDNICQKVAYYYYEKVKDPLTSEDYILSISNIYNVHNTIKNDLQLLIERGITKEIISTLL